MQAGAGQAATWRLAWIVAPAALDAGRMLVAEIALDMKDVAKGAVRDNVLELPHAWKATFVVAEGKGDVGLGASRDSPFSIGAAKRQWLLAPYRFACLRYRAYLRDVQGMRCCQKNRLHARVRDRLFEFSRQFESLGRREFAHQLGLFADPANEAQALAFALHRLDDVFSPSAKADYGGIYHGRKGNWARQNTLDLAY